MKASLSFADTNEKAVRERNIKTRAIPICCYIIILRIFSVPYEGIAIVIEVKVADMALLFIREPGVGGRIKMRGLSGNR